MSSTEINVEGVPTLKRDIISSFPPVGTVLPIVLNLEENPIQPYSPGNWVKFRNLTCRVHSGIYETIFLRESKLSLLSSRCELVEKRERYYEKVLIIIFLVTRRKYSSTIQIQDDLAFVVHICVENFNGGFLMLIGGCLNQL